MFFSWNIQKKLEGFLFIKTNAKHMKNFVSRRIEKKYLNSRCECVLNLWLSFVGKVYPQKIISIVHLIKNKIEKKTYSGLRHNAPRATLIVVVLAASRRCGREEIPSCRGSMEEMNIDACLSVADGCCGESISHLPILNLENFCLIITWCVQRLCSQILSPSFLVHSTHRYLWPGVRCKSLSLVQEKQRHVLTRFTTAVPISMWRFPWLFLALGIEESVHGATSTVCIPF